MGHKYPLFLPNVTKVFTDFECKLRDENERIIQTRKALYIILEKRYFEKIVLVDGSNYPILSDPEINEISNKYGVKIEQLFFQQNINLVNKYGKGNGEMQITNYMLQNSKLVNEVGGFIKLTPRYIFDNIDTIIPLISEKKNIFFFYYPPLLRKIKPFVMTIFYKTSIEFYKTNIEASLREHNKSVYGNAESVFYRQIHNLKKEGIKCSYPHFSGTSGTSGKKITNSYRIFRNISSKLGLMGYSFE